MSLRFFFSMDEYAVICDYDGFLVDSGPVRREFYRYLCRKYGKEMPEKKLQKLDYNGLSICRPYRFKETENIVLPAETIYDLMGFDWEKDKGMIWDEFIEYFLKHPPLMFPGIKKSLIRLKAKDFKIALATSNSRELVLPFIERKGLEHVFDVVVTKENVEKPKPYPDMLVKCSEGLGIPREKCLYGGDEIADLMAAKLAGIAVVGAGYGLTPQEVMLQFINKDRFVERPEDLADVMLKNIAYLQKIQDLRAKAQKLLL